MDSPLSIKPSPASEGDGSGAEGERVDPRWVREIFDMTAQMFPPNERKRLSRKVHQGKASIPESEKEGKQYL